MTHALLAALALAAGAPAPPRFDGQGRALGAPLSDRVTGYAIEARLDPAAGSLAGSERVTWRNRSAEPQRLLWFHLYWNAFSGDRSASARQARSGFRSGFPERKEADFGWSELSAVRLQGRDLLPAVRFRHPEEATASSLGLPPPVVPGTPPEDRTVFTVELPEPVAPGASVELELEWRAHVPLVVARTGRLGDFFLLGQWFPKLGVLELPGERGATAPRWNCHTFWAWTEFYADFGTYDVTLTLPARMVVGATGGLVERREGPDGLATWRFRQEDVHDFAWTAWEGFQVVEDRFSEPGLPEVALRLLLHPEHEKARDQYLQAAKAALRHAGERYAAYPFAQLTLVDPPEPAHEAGGMEYPTLVTLGTRRGVPPRDYETWNVAVHEVFHNVFQGLVASNEFEEAWLDEGLTTYATQGVMLEADLRARPAAYLPPWARRLLPGLAAISLDELALARASLQGDPLTPMATPSWAFRSMGDWAGANYHRMSAALTTLERLAPPGALARGLRAYAQRWQFRHPGRADLLAALEPEVGPGPLAVFRQLLDATSRLDYAAEGIVCQPEDEARLSGWTWEAGAQRRFVDAARATGAPGGYRCRVTVQRKGGVVAPVEVEVTFDDGTALTERWTAEEQQGGPRWRRFEYLRPARVQQVRVDPLHRLVADEDRANDSATRQPDARVASRLLGWLAFALQGLLSLLAGLL